MMKIYAPFIKEATLRVTMTLRSEGHGGDPSPKLPLFKSLLTFLAYNKSADGNFVMPKPPKQLRKHYHNIPCNPNRDITENAGLLVFCNTSSKSEPLRIVIIKFMAPGSLFLYC